MLISLIIVCHSGFAANALATVRIVFGADLRAIAEVRPLHAALIEFWRDSTLAVSFTLYLFFITQDRIGSRRNCSVVIIASQRFAKFIREQFRPRPQAEFAQF